MGTLELTGSPLEPHLDGSGDRLQAPLAVVQPRNRGLQMAARLLSSVSLFLIFRR